MDLSALGALDMSKVVVDLCDSSGEEPRGSAVVEPCVSAVIEPCVSAGASTSAVINLCSPAVADTSAGGKQRNRKERNGKEPIDVGARSDDGAPDSCGYVVIDLCGDDDAVGADQDSDKGFARQLQLAFDGIECIGERFEGCAEVGPSSKRRRGGANDTLQDQLERDISHLDEKEEDDLDAFLQKAFNIFDEDKSRSLDKTEILDIVMLMHKSEKPLVQPVVQPTSG